jgi:hypothetical protein
MHENKGCYPVTSVNYAACTVSSLHCTSTVLVGELTHHKQSFRALQSSWFRNNYCTVLTGMCRQPCQDANAMVRTRTLSVNWFSKPTHWHHHGAAPWSSFWPWSPFFEEFKLLVHSFRCFKAVKLILWQFWWRMESIIQAPDGIVHGWVWTNPPAVEEYWIDTQACTIRSGAVRTIDSILHPPSKLS